jgi:23S rRNA (guanine745-N1)-methyltransferase
LGVIERALACVRGHRFDVARQGHVALLPPRGRAAPGDPAAMVAARAAFLSGGHYASIAAAVTGAALDARGPVARADSLVADLGAGTGAYLAALLEQWPGARGLALDASRPALRHAVRAHRRIAAVACDVWQGLPVRSGAADVVLDVFAPRNGGETARILAPRGALVVVTPTPAHLHQLVARLGLVRVDPDKCERLHAELSPGLSATRTRRVEFDMVLHHHDLEALIGMGPSAHHLDADDLRHRVAHLPATLRVTASVVVQTFRRA